MHEFDYAGVGYVVKFVRAGTGLVDGHDALTLGRKADQIALIHRACPRLAARIVAPLLVYRGSDGCALLMPREDGTPLLEVLENSGEHARFFDALAPILTDLIEHGYMASVVAAEPSTFARLHIDRVQRRLGVVLARLDPDLLDGGVRINGRRCRSLEDLLADLRSRPRLLAALDAPVLNFPVHGDLNADNVFRRIGGGERDYFVLDPRGVTEHWDAIYDMGKLLFSLAGLHTGMRSGFEVRRAPGAVEVDVRSGQTAAFESAADDFATFLAGLPAFGRLIEGDPHWLLRLHMSTAMHMLAEVACRFSDTKRNPTARAELATGLYAMGILSATRLLEHDDAELLSGPVSRPRWRHGR
ncbi:hypothetical protein ACW9G9_10930 [Nocardia asiatica]